MWDVKEPTPPFEKSRGHRPRWCGQPSHIIHIMDWVGIQQTHKWSDIGCQWRSCTLTCELTVNMLIYKTVEKLLSTTVLFRTTMLIHIVKRACLLSSHPRLLPSLILFVTFKGEGFFFRFVWSNFFWVRQVVLCTTTFVQSPFLPTTRWNC